MVASAETGVTDSTITIGTFGAFTGPAAAYAKTWYGVEAYYNEINAKGGINGRKIKLVKEDDVCDPGKGMAAVKKLIAQGDVFLIHGGLCSNVAIAARPEIEKSGIPWMVLASASTPISTPFAKNIFSPVATTDTVAEYMVDFAMTKPGIKKIAFISHSDDWGQSNRKPALAHMKAKHKAEPILDLSMEKGSTDATPQVLRLRESGADAVLALLYPTEIAIFLRDARKLGLNVPMLATQGVSLELTRQRVPDPAATDNLYVFYPLAHPVDSPQMAHWVKTVNRYFPNEKVETFTLFGLGGATAVVKALEAAGPNLTRARFMAELEKLRDFDTGILSAKLNFTPSKHTGVDRGAMITFRGGKPALVTSLR
jgi:branched-chain amino acid transport system substrate-binding protein